MKHLWKFQTDQTSGTAAKNRQSWRVQKYLFVTNGLIIKKPFCFYFYCENLCVKVELCCKRGGGGVRGLALVLTAMNLARHSKEGKHRQFQMSSLIRKQNHSIPLFVLMFFTIIMVCHSDKIAVDWLLPRASLWVCIFCVIILDMETNPSSPHSSCWRNRFKTQQHRKRLEENWIISVFSKS